MPYISQDERQEIDSYLEPLIAKLKDSPTDRLDGRLNYVVSRLLASLYRRKYFDYNRAMGVLACASFEFYRRVVAAYEDEKLKEQGDIY